MTLAKRRITRKQTLEHRSADMVTCNKTQLIAAIQSVPHDCDTVIEAVDANDRVLVRYAFSHKKTPTYLPNHEKHIANLAAAIRRTPANIWR